ncbi:DinB family protein [Paenibacillus sp. GYB003]|uniref:DinB family protein n=1 Tax=Paenibacillus sp. GYB003 TaxID=2994392 RepID=UPI002F96CB9C
MEAMIFRLLDMSRSRTLQIAADVTESQADVVPEGFNNNIRWNLGHIVTVQERFAFRLIGEPMDLPEELMSLFVGGTKPADWQTPAPGLAELRTLLEEQPERIRKRIEGRLDEKLKVPFKELDRLADVLAFGVGHEGLHAGYIQALKRVVAQTESGR